MINFFLRLLSSLLGFLIGASFCVGSIILFFAVYAFVNDQPFWLPRWSGWLTVFTFGIGVGFARYFYRYEKVFNFVNRRIISNISTVFSIETKFDRVRIVLIGIWFVLACLYITLGYDRQFRRLDLLNLRSWGDTEWLAVRLVFMPMLIIFFGLPIFYNIYVWVKSGK